MKAKINIKGGLMNKATIGVGAIAGAYVDKISFVSTLSPMVKGLAKIVVGAIGPQMLGKGKSAALITGMGDGFIAVGALQFANATLFKANPVTISGLPTLNGYDSYNAAALHGGEQGGDLQTLGTAGGGMDNY